MGGEGIQERNLLGAVADAPERAERTVGDERASMLGISALSA